MTTPLLQKENDRHHLATHFNSTTSTQLITTSQATAPICKFHRQKGLPNCDNKKRRRLADDVIDLSIRDSSTSSDDSSMTSNTKGMIHRCYSREVLTKNFKDICDDLNTTEQDVDNTLLNLHKHLDNLVKQYNLSNNNQNSKITSTLERPRNQATATSVPDKWVDDRLVKNDEQSAELLTARSLNSMTTFPASADDDVIINRRSSSNQESMPNMSATSTTSSGIFNKLWSWFGRFIAGVCQLGSCRSRRPGKRRDLKAATRTCYFDEAAAVELAELDSNFVRNSTNPNIPKRSRTTNMAVLLKPRNNRDRDWYNSVELETL